MTPDITNITTAAVAEPVAHRTRARKKNKVETVTQEVFKPADPVPVNVVAVVSEAPSLRSRFKKAALTTGILGMVATAVYNWNLIYNYAQQQLGYPTQSSSWWPWR